MKLRNDSGFSMIEVLVTLVILSIGLLGVAGLQTASLRFSQESYFQSQAVALVSDMIDRMRSNRNGIDSNKYNGINTNASKITAITKDCFSAKCTADEIATFDLENWALNVAKFLPGGVGKIDKAANSNYTVTVMWDHARTGATGEACDSSNPANLKCYQVSVRL